MKIFKYYLPMLAVIISSLMVIMSPSFASASTDWSINTLDTLMMKDQNTGASFDSSLTWSESINSCPDPQYATAWANRTNWAVTLFGSNQPNNPDNRTTANILFVTTSTPSNSYTDFVKTTGQSNNTNTLMLRSTGNIYNVQFSKYNGSYYGAMSCSIITPSNGLSSFGLSTKYIDTEASWNSWAGKWLFLSTFPVTYPTDYTESQTIPTSYQPKINYRPYVGYVVDGYTVTTIGGKDPKDIGGIPYGIDYTMSQKQTDGSYKDLYTWQSPVTQYANTFKITTGFGDYKLKAHIRHPGPPYAPFDSQYVLTDSTYNIKIDGSSYDSSTIDNSACTNGVCAVASPYKDCTTFGTDLVGGFNCVLTNFGTWLRAVLVSIFGPQSAGNFTDYISNNNTNTFGLTAVITAPLQILQRMSTSYYTCSDLVLPLPHLGANLTLPCMNTWYSNNLGALYNMYQTIINGVVAYYVLVGILNMVKGFKDPESDKIEVLAL